MARYCSPSTPPGHPHRPGAKPLSKPTPHDPGTSSSTVRLLVNNHATSLKYYVFGYRSMAPNLDMLDRRDDINDVMQWSWSDVTGIVTLQGVKIDPRGTFFVVAFNTVTYRTPAPMVVYGNDKFGPLTPAGYLFEISPTGVDHTITQTITNTDGFASAIDAVTKGGTAGLTVPLGPVSGNVGGSFSTTHTNPTNSGSTASGGSNTYTVKVVDGISVHSRSDIPRIQSFNLTPSSSAYG